MTKREFIAVLQRELYNLPKSDLEEQLSFYNEMIDDGMEEGLTEEQAVAKIGSISEILSQINHQKITYTDKAKTIAKEKRKISAGTLTLIIAGSPIWIAILASLFAAVISLYVGLWVVATVVCAVGISFGAVAICALPLAVIYCFKGAIIGAVFVLGAGLTCAGITVFMWYGCKHTVLLCARWTVWSFMKIISPLNFRRW